MKVVICGSLKQETEIFGWKTVFEKMGAEVTTPFSDRIRDLSLFEKRCQYVDVIADADVVVFVAKCYFSEYCAEGPDYLALELGESTSYEYAIAKHFNKKIMFV